ncbi:galactosylceramide sulfotransferase-like isoform X1 [Penaeus chinensis]|uniref:galactosylceramide sulfotransferase-like isoform X1 n=1 Tax=Penaeus chinensis TaxID=139456 RepID=UPI001FB5BA03|nr:galactosylceramide sulfotransferase-like isoform X1 [Penaeus chinensis]
MNASTLCTKLAENQLQGRALYTRHLKTVVGGLVLVTLVMLVMYTTPTPTALILSAANSLRDTEKFPKTSVSSGKAGYDVAASLRQEKEKEEKEKEKEREKQTEERQVERGIPEKVFGPSSQERESLRSEVLMAGDGAEAQCRPQHHVMFLKTHKCASSTVQNIFLRYGYTNNLTFALPGGGNYLGNPGLFKAGLIPKNLLPPSGKVDIFAVHTRLNFKEHSSVLHNDTRWVTLVRDPATLYESLFNFFHLKNGYNLDLSSFSSQPMSRLMELPRYGGKFGKNQMLFDLGYSDNMSVTQLRQAIEELDGLFDLVMVAERMDESLVLLRHLLCWSLHDVVVFTKNARRQEVKPTLDPQTRQTLRELNSADALLYDHFMAKHRRAVLEFGVRRMADEVSALRSLRDEYFEDCGAREVKGKDSTLKFKEYSGLVSSYVTSNNSDQNCLMLSLPELPLVDTVRRKQLKTLEEMRAPS